MSVTCPSGTRTQKSAVMMATAQVVLGTLCWGFGFVATKWVVGVVPPFSMSVVRFFVAWLVAAPFVLSFARERLAFRWGEAKRGLVPGFWLAVLMMFQTAGIRHTTVTNSSFITTLYVVIVPICASVMCRQKIQRSHWAFVGVAVLGTGLICKLESFEINVGDALTLVGAFAASIHMLAIEARARVAATPMSLNLFQSAWAAIFTLPIAIILESSQWPSSLAIEPRVWLGFLFLVGPCTLVAFGLQVAAQRVLPAVGISLLFLLESPFAAMFGNLFLGERLALSQWVGAVLILAAAVGSALSARGKH